MLIIREAISHSLVLLALALLFKAFETALEMINGQFPHTPGLSYFPLDTIRLMVTIADSVAVILFGLLMLHTVVRFRRLLRGGK